jgi:LPPG:FO 2-phospho-L-lactate transferase
VKVTALAGGVGGAKLAVGLQKIAIDKARADDLTVVVNTADDTIVYGLHVSPDVDIVTYWLAGMADLERGWGIRGDTFAVVDALGELGVENWFRLGDRDFATCAYRTARLAEGVSFSDATDEIRRSLGVGARVLPMSDDPVRSIVHTTDGRTLAFQEYFVKERHEPHVERVEFDGLPDAKPAPGLLEALETADAIVLCPSNPFVSIGPIIALPGVRAALVNHPRVIAVSPIVKGEALKGPAADMLATQEVPVSAAGVASLYRDFCDTYVIDSADGDTASEVEALGMQPLVLDTIMSDAERSSQLARDILSSVR